MPETTNPTPKDPYALANQHRQNALEILEHTGDIDFARESLDCAIEMLDLGAADMPRGYGSFSANFNLIQGYIDTAEAAITIEQPATYVKSALDKALDRTSNMRHDRPSLAGIFIYKIASAAHRSGQSDSYIEDVLKIPLREEVRLDAFKGTLQHANHYGLNSEFSRRVIKQAQDQWFDEAVQPDTPTGASIKKLLGIAKVAYRFGGEANADLIPDMLLEGATIAAISDDRKEEVESLARLAMFADATDQPREFTWNMLRRGIVPAEKLKHEEPVAAIEGFSLLAQVGVELEMLDIAQEAASRGVAVAYFSGENWRRRHERLQRALRGIDVSETFSDKFITNLGVEKRPYNYAFTSDQF
jgi:hypothetical protein